MLSGNGTAGVGSLPEIVFGSSSLELRLPARSATIVRRSLVNRVGARGGL